MPECDCHTVYGPGHGLQKCGGHECAACHAPFTCPFSCSWPRSVYGPGSVTCVMCQVANTIKRIKAK